MLYTADLMKLITTNGLRPRIYADDTQIYGFCAPTATQALLDQVAACISDVSVAAEHRQNRSIVVRSRSSSTSNSQQSTVRVLGQRRTVEARP